MMKTTRMALVAALVLMWGAADAQAQGRSQFFNPFSVKSSRPTSWLDVFTPPAAAASKRPSTPPGQTDSPPTNLPDQATGPPFTPPPFRSPYAPPPRPPFIPPGPPF